MKETLTILRRKLQPVFHKYQKEILFCYCFGSLTENNYTDRSDIDLAFYVQSDYANYDFKLTLYADCSRVLKRNDIDILILNNLNNLILLESIVNYGKLLYETNKDERINFELKITHQAIDFRYQRKLAMGF